MLFFLECTSTILSVNVSVLILLWMSWIGIFKVLFSPAHCLHSLYSLQSNVIHIGSALETTTFSCQSATSLVASLLLYVVFFDVNMFS